VEIVRKSQQKLERFLEKTIDKTARIALVGVGNKDRQDDFVGLYVIQMLQAKGLQKENILLVEAGDAPTQFIPEIHTWDPEYILMIDAVDAKQIPGTVLNIPKDALNKYSIDSHSNAKILLLDFLLGLNPKLQIYILGIQVKEISFMQQLSEEVLASADWLIEVFYRLLD